jgi:hypothetical protein
MLTTPGQYQIIPGMGGGTAGVYYGFMWIAPVSPVAAVPAPEPTPFALLGLVTFAYLLRRARAAWKQSATQGHASQWRRAEQAGGEAALWL